MPESQEDKKAPAIIPFWVFFAAGSKWLGGFVGGCLGLYGSEMLTTDLVWISIVTASMTFMGWSTGTYLDINTYLAERKPK